MAAAGTRADAVMTRISQQLSPVDRQAVVLYYAGLSAQAPQVWSAAADAGLIQRGATLYAQGSAEHGIQSCANCHGPGGRGLSHVYPSVAGGRPADDGRRHPCGVGVCRQTRAVRRLWLDLTAIVWLGLASCDLSETG
jgi:cytochrome c553